MSEHDYSADYDLTGTVWSTDSGETRKRPYVTEAERLAVIVARATERLAVIVARATERLREEERVLEDRYGVGILDAVDDWRHELEDERESRI